MERRSRERAIPRARCVVRGAKLKTRKIHIDRALQLLYPLELRREHKQESKRTETDQEEKLYLDPEAQGFRPRRNAATVARQFKQF